jgi:CRP-like cAMP-binding protein
MTSPNLRRREDGHAEHAKERRMSDSPIEQALACLLSDAPDEALRWSAAALESDARSVAALLVTARALARVGRKRAAVDGFFATARRAATLGDAPIAIAAVAELRALGVETDTLLDEVAAAVCREPAGEASWSQGSAWRGSLQPMSPLLPRRAVASRATELVYEAAGTERPVATTTAFLGTFAPAAFRELAGAFRAIVVPAGYRAIEEDAPIRDIFVVACGEVEVSRKGAHQEARSLATLESGSMFGEMSMVARLPSATSAITTRPTILLVAPRAALETIGARHKDLRLELGIHCRRQAVGNLGAACEFVTTVPIRDRSALVDRMATRTYGRGERLVTIGEDAAGLHLILAGEVALVGHDGGDDRVILSTLGAGDVVGEAELVLCRRAETEAIAAGPAATLFLPRDEYFALALDYPAILHGLYSAAIRRVGETGEALQAGATGVTDAELQFDELPPAFALAPEASAEGVGDAEFGEVPLALLVDERPRPELDERDERDERNRETRVEGNHRVARAETAERVGDAELTIEPELDPEPETQAVPPVETEPDPTIAVAPAELAAHIAQARPSSPPPPRPSARPPKVSTAPPASAREILSAPASSLAPVVAASTPPPASKAGAKPASASAPRGSFARWSAQGAALVAVAASVAVVLATREDRPSALSLPQTGARGVAEDPVSSAVVTAPVAAPPPTGSPSPATNPPTGAGEATRTAPSTTTPPPATKAFLASSLKKRPARASTSSPPNERDDQTADEPSPPQPVASASTPPAPRAAPPAASSAAPVKQTPVATPAPAVPAPRPAASSDNSFGGRE